MTETITWPVIHAARMLENVSTKMPAAVDVSKQLIASYMRFRPCFAASAAVDTVIHQQENKERKEER